MAARSFINFLLNGLPLAGRWSSHRHCSPRSFYWLFLLGALLSTFQALALDPQKALTQYQHELWRSRDGLTQNAIKAITQTPDGYLWIGTDVGLFRFDGVHFKKFNRFNLPDWLGDEIRSLEVGTHGELLVGNRETLLIYERGEFTELKTPEGGSVQQPNYFYKAGDGYIWLGTESGQIFKYRDRKLERWELPSGPPTGSVNCFYQDETGALWIGTSARGLLRYQDGQLAAVDTGAGVRAAQVRHLVRDPEGGLWVVYQEAYVSRLYEGQWTPYDTHNEIGTEQVVNIFFDRDGQLWIGTRDAGLYRHWRGKFDRMDAQRGLSSNYVAWFYEDREGVLWVGTVNGGLESFKDGKYTLYRLQEGLVDYYVWPILPARDGSLWVGTQRGVSVLRDGKFQNYTKAEGLSDNMVWSLHEARDGSIWFGSVNGGVSRLKDDQFTHYDTRHGLTTNYVWSVYEDRQGTIWFGTQGGGLNYLRDGQFGALTSRDGLANDEIRLIHEDRFGNLWCSSRNAGLNRLREGHITHLNLANGLAGNEVRAIHEDMDGVLWFGTKDNGLSRYDGGEIKNFGLSQGLLDTSVYGIIDDRAGNFWLYSDRLLYRVSRQELNDVADGRTNRVHGFSYGTDDGLRGAIFTSGQSPQGGYTADGKLWLPTVRGLMQVDTKRLMKSELKPLVHIEEVLSDYQSVKSRSGDISLPPGVGSLEIHYTALSFLMPQRVRFEYRLEGVDENWVKAGNRRMAHYTNLRPGQYRFHVRACNHDNVWSEGTATLSIYLAPFFYQTTTFYLLAGSTLVLLLAGAHLWRVERTKKHAAELTRLVAERTQNLQVEIGVRQRAEEAQRETARRLREQQAALMELAYDKERHPDNLRALFRSLTETAARTLQVERASVWLFDEERTTIHCVSLYLLSRHEHTIGAELKAAEYPAYFRAIEESRTLAVADAAQDERTREFQQHYLQPLGIRSLLDAPVRLGGKIVGILCHEHTDTIRAWTEEEESFAGSLGDIAALILEAIERKRAETAVQRTEELYRRAIVAAESVPYQLDYLSNRFVFMGEGIAALTGYAASEMTPALFESLRQESYMRGAAAGLSTEEAQRRIRAGEIMQWQNDCRILMRNGQSCWLADTSVEIYDVGGKPIGSIGILQDISDRKRSEEALRESEQRFRRLAEATSEGIVILENGRIMEANQTLATMFGYRLDEIIGESVLKLTAPISRGLLQKIILTGYDRPYEAFGLKKDGTEFPVEIAGKACLYEGRPARVSVVRNITDRKMVEQTLRDLSRHVLDAQEGERLRVARELHDSVNQILSSAKFRLQAVQEQMVNFDPALRENSERAKNLLERAIKEVRLISQNLRPSELDDLGLLSAIRSACAEFQERTGVPVVLENTGFPERLTPEIELPFYRLVQEALTNIEKHAQASRVEIILTGEGGLLELVLHDDGRGFDPANPRERPDGKPGFGMENMRERAVSLGGTFVLDSQPGQGTRITVRIPYHGVAET